VRIYPILDIVGGPLVASANALLAVVEPLLPLRPRVLGRLQRVPGNLAMAGAALVVVRLAVVPAMMWAARRASKRRSGILYLLPLPGVARAAIGFLLLDYTMYLWHRLNHHVPALWRFHRVHHTDLDLDVTTAFRFHFGELLASVAFRAAQVTALGAGPRAVLVYEVIMQAATAFHHANIRLPVWLERALNAAIVTPRMHGIHHSVKEEEVGSNWSVIFSCWDRLHRTFSPPLPERPVTIGVPEYREPEGLTLRRLLAMPFSRAASGPRAREG
jgi:sterol desaturase/sphingolipid hydroxylase (fatty acid hydroxylase superfamily)